MNGNLDISNEIWFNPLLYKKENICGVKGKKRNIQKNIFDNNNKEYIEQNKNYLFLQKYFEQMYNNI